MPRHICSGVCEQDLVAFPYEFLAPGQVVGYEVDAFRPEIPARGRLPTDGRDVEVIFRLVVSPVAFVKLEGLFPFFFFCEMPNHLPIEAEVGDFITIV